MADLDINKTLSQEPPAATAVQVAANMVQPEQVALQGPEELPPEAMHNKAGTVALIPTTRIDGASKPSPWGEPEPGIWWLLSQSEVEHVEERSLDGTGGYFWARTRKPTGELVSIVLKPDSLKTDLYKNWTAEFYLDSSKHSLVSREQAAYEIAKAMGMENQVPPLAAKEIKVGTILGLTSKEVLSKHLRASRGMIEEILGDVAIAQLVIADSVPLGEYLNSLGETPEDKWSGASDSLRHSIYCMIALDFLLGTGERSLSSLSYNPNLDKLNVYDLSLSLPHPGFSAEKIMRQRAAGWSRNVVPGAKQQRNGPISSIELFNFIHSMKEEQKHECTMTFQQLGTLLTPGKVSLLARIMFELGVPVQCIAGFAAKVKYLQTQPHEVLKDPVGFNQNVSAACRRGYGLDENRVVIDFANQVIQSIDNSVDFLSICQEPLDNPNLKLA
jgi:hypothetical protein